MTIEKRCQIPEIIRQSFFLLKRYSTIPNGPRYYHLAGFMAHYPVAKQHNDRGWNFCQANFYKIDTNSGMQLAERKPKYTYQTEMIEFYKDLLKRI